MPADVSITRTEYEPGNDYWQENRQLSKRGQREHLDYILIYVRINRSNERVNYNLVILTRPRPRRTGIGECARG